MRETSMVLRTDSYKVSHWAVFPEGTEYMWRYMESRGGLYSEVVMFGLQYYLKRYLTTPITKEDVDYAERRMAGHIGTAKVFNRKGWDHVVRDHGGLLPIEIKAVPEGMVVPTHNILLSVKNTCPKCAWIDVETLLLKTWYPITVATLSREIKKDIAEALRKTGDINLLPFKLHDFGYRGVSSEESAMIGGMAHLVNFMGTDTILALEGADEFYGEEMAGFSIPATEHSVMTAKGQEGEVHMMKRFLDAFRDGPYPAIVCVSDQYDIFNACKNLWGRQLKGDVESLDGKVLVVRPDSGTPHVVVRQVVEALDSAFGHTLNDKGYKVLNHVRVIQGDGINHSEVKRILSALTDRKWSADNIAFGMGGALLQAVNRDTQHFAIKSAEITINGIVSDVFKSPVTDNNKRSKRGRQKLIRDESGVLSTVPANSVAGHDILETVFLNGKLVKEYTFAEIRERAALPEPEVAGVY